MVENSTANRIEWTEERFGTGIEEIDRQHRELFDRVNLLLDACAGLSPEREVHLTLNFLSWYTTTHFVYEDRFMRQHGSPTADANGRAHEGFVEKLQDLKQRFHAEGAAPDLLAEIERFLMSWMTDHVERIDVPGLRAVAATL